MNLPADYEERVYAGVLGKCIGVYLGRPFEGWSNARIERELGEVWYYVNRRLGAPLVVTDDDLSGTFTFVRAFSDNGCPYEVTSEQIADVWLNHLIEHRTVLWWGGMGTSTEHTAWLRLRDGIRPPLSGSIERNGRVVAEQIGAQIFIDGWAMLCPGDPGAAVELARRAACVSHDGEAIHAAQALAAMQALAFVESDRDRLLDAAMTFLPKASLIHRMIGDIRSWHGANPHDWRATFRRIEENYGYDRYGGGCHVVPNHAVIVMALLHGDDDFQKSLMIANTAGWDTDCNSGNIGALMGIKLGLAGIDEGPDWRSPVADRLYLPTADPGTAITDAATQAMHLVNIARSSRGMRPVAPNGGMRYHFALPGSSHGFVPEDSDESAGTTVLENVVLGALAEGAGVAADERALAIRYKGVAPGRTARAATATFFPPEALAMGGYGVSGAPILYPGQVVRSRVVADGVNTRAANVRLYVRVYGAGNRLETMRGPVVVLEPGTASNLSWEIPDTGGKPVAEVGVKVGGHSGTGALYVDWLGWNGVPNCLLGQPTDAERDGAWARAWVNAADRFDTGTRVDGSVYRIVQDTGVGMAFTGGAEWRNITVSATAKAHLAGSIGLMANVRGLRRHVALILEPEGTARLVRTHDAHEELLVETGFLWEPGREYRVSVTTRDDGSVRGVVDDGNATVFLEGRVPIDGAHGGIGLRVAVGNAAFGPVRVEPAQ
ncbi:MAG: ADP-ribosylglycohydrolase family protein [Armatimonadota bacterium]